MTIKEIISQFGNLKVCEERLVEEKKGEFVVFNEDLEAWNNLFVKILGPAIKPVGVKPNAEQSALAKSHGGIFDSQTLYKKDFSGYQVIVMFWPWGDKAHTTIKLALVER